MDNLFWIGFVGAAIAGVFAWMQAKKVLALRPGLFHAFGRDQAALAVSVGTTFWQKLARNSAT